MTAWSVPAEYVTSTRIAVTDTAVTAMKVATISEGTGATTRKNRTSCHIASLHSCRRVAGWIARRPHPRGHLSRCRKRGAIGVAEIRLQRVIADVQHPAGASLVAPA